MPHLRTLAALLLTAPTVVLAGNYVLTIDGQPHELELGTQQTLKLASGTSIQVQLAKKDVVTYRSKMFSFDHANRLEPSKSEIQAGLSQTFASTPVGTLVMVQEYETLDPTSLVEMMLGVMTKDDADLGRKIERTNVQKKLANGTLLAGRRATFSSDDGQMEVEVYAKGQKNKGVIIVTQIDRTNPPEEAELHQRFWKTLQLSIQ